MDGIQFSVRKSRHILLPAAVLLGLLVVSLDIAILAIVDSFRSCSLPPAAEVGQSQSGVTDQQQPSSTATTTTTTTTTTTASDPQTKVSRDVFGTTRNNEVIYRYRLVSQLGGLQVDVITLGATITAIKSRDRYGNISDVTLGYDTIQDYEAVDNPYFGAVIGRVANRIKDAKFTLNDIVYNLTLNDRLNTHHLHGGTNGWNRAVWKGSIITGRGIVLSHVSPDGDEGYPGEVHVNVTYLLTDDNQLIIQLRAVAVNKSTPINLTIHPYFNLAGQGTILEHNVTIFADYYLPTDDELIPTGDILPVNNSLFDLRQSTRLAHVLPHFNGSGYDNNFCLRGPVGTRLAARVYENVSGRELEIYTNERGIQFYTGNFLNGTRGKDGNIYGQYSGFCLETQNYPDAIHHITFPDCILHENSTYEHHIVFKFSAY